MDLLTDILNTSGLRKRLLHQRSLYTPWALKFPCPLSMGFHVITQGNAYLWTDTQTPVALSKGDIVFMARGAHHHISTHPEPELILNASSVEDFESPQRTEKKPLLTCVSGAYQLWNDPIHPLFQELPQWWVLRSEDIAYSDSLQHCLSVLSQELKQGDRSSEAIINSLLDVIFHLVLRRILAEESQPQSWGNAQQDPLIRKALHLMHRHPETPWSVHLLAQKVGLSRSGFSNKFKASLGDTPLHYLTTLRMSKAMHLLANTQNTLESIAHQVGYKDAFGFSKSFKKSTGMSPKTFRKHNAQENPQIRFQG